MEAQIDATSDFWSKHPEIFQNTRLLRELNCYDQELAYKFINLSTHDRIRVESWIDKNHASVDMTETQRKIAIRGLHSKLVNRALLAMIKFAMKDLGFMS